MRVLLSLSMLLWCATAHARERRLSFDEAVGFADANPAVLGTERAAEQLRDASHRSPALDANPNVTLGFGPRLAPSSEKGFEGSLAVTQSLSVHDSSDKRRAAIRAEAQWMQAELHVERLDKRASAAAAWLDLWLAEQLLGLSRDDLRNEEALMHLIQRLVAAGERTQADAASAETRVADAQWRERAAEGSLVEARSVLSAVYKSSSDEELQTDGQLPDVPLLAAAQIDELGRSISQRPSVRARALLSEAELARGAEERAQRESRVTLGTEARRDALGATVVQGTLQVPVNLFELGAREYAARSAAAARAAGQAADEENKTRAAFAAMMHEVEHTEEVHALLAQTLVPAAERASSLRARQIKVGESTVLELIDARRTAFDARSKLVRAARDRTWARVRAQLLLRSMREKP